MTNDEKSKEESENEDSLEENTENLVGDIDIFDQLNEYPEEFPNEKAIFGITLSVNSMETLRPNTQIDDNVIDVLFLLLKNYSKKVRGLDVLSFPCMLGKTLMNVENKVNFSAWANQSKIWEKRIWLIPVHKNEHWTLLIIFPQDELMIYLDSLKKDTPPELIAGVCSFMNMIPNSKTRRGKKAPINWNKWKLYEPKDIANQRDAGRKSYDNCAVHAMSWGFITCTGLPFEFSELDMNSARRGIARIIYGSKTTEIQDNNEIQLLATLFTEPAVLIKPNKKTLKILKTSPENIKTFDYLVSYAYN